jgi:hypothetical protein
MGGAVRISSAIASPARRVENSPDAVPGGEIGTGEFGHAADRPAARR